MSRIAVVAALHDELSGLLAAMPDAQSRRRGGRDFRVGRLDGREVVVVLSRVGKVAAATTAAILASEFDVAAIVVTGAAGGLHASARVGDVVVAETLLQHDLDASPLFPRYEVPLYGRARFECDAPLSAALAVAARQALAAGDVDAALLARFDAVSPAVRRGLVVSGDRFVATAAENAELRRRLPEALAVEMEGAAIAQVAHDFGLPCAVVRVVSDRADAAAPVDFLRFTADVASPLTLAIVRRFLRAGGGAAPPVVPGSPRPAKTR